MSVNAISTPQRGLVTAGHVMVVAVLLAVVGCATQRPWIPPETFAHPTFLTLDPSWTDPSVNPVLSVLEPSNDRDWSADQAVLPHAEFDGDRVRVHNIRNCHYRGQDDYTVDYYDKTFDLDKLDSVDFIMVPFAEAPTMAHTMLSFGFEGKDYLVLSVEVRKEKGETYDPLRGLLRQYEIMYVLGDERDLVGLRANHRLNDVYIYRAQASRRQARALFVDVIHRVNQLHDEPEFYDTLTNNCTTNIVDHVNHLAPDRVPYDYRVLLPGYSDRLAYDLGLLDTHGTFEQTKARARVNYLAYLHRNGADFSAKIRQ